MEKKINTIWDAGEDLSAMVSEMRFSNLYDGLSDGEILENAERLHSEYLEDERCNLNIHIGGEIIAIGTIQRWNGTVQGYKLLHSDNIKDILYSTVRGDSECHWYADAHNVCCDECHHDGTNHYVYRMIRNGRDIDRFLEKIYQGVPYTARMLNYYTKSIRPEVAEVYGW